ncbi:trans-sialidase [Trypanosoma cruzi cruzi]|uniref:Putative trans-sialidase, Group V n=1 Tax=Trypanosoma cruzi TaxID=5693 RepID=A0A2V2VZT8_TRYCR|nr:trans-sialidase [Trypanosoma cruzi cruzi]PWV01898.1 putative trans-sialidase, Group V [Trypanosoma cruzi]
MLSRVAAVKAPRTHNRRRVTGSSGRRRKGRESEPPRPNMSRRLFASAVLFLLVVVMCCDTGGAAAAEDTSSGQGAPSEKYYVWTEKKAGETVSSLRVPSLVEMDGEVFAVAEAQLKDESGFTGIASELLTLTDKVSKELVKAQMKTQVLVECSSDKDNCASREAAQAGSQSETRVRVSRPTTVVEGSDIYMLVGKYCRKPAAACAGGSEADEWGLLLVKGQVSGNGESSKGILWKETNDFPQTTFVKEPQSLKRLIGGGGSGVTMEDGTLVFPVEATKKEEEKTVSLIIYSLKDTNTWTLSKEMSDGGCSDPSVVEWGEKDKKIIMMTACDDGRRRVYESGDKGESWTEALGTLSRVWGNKQGEGAKAVRSGFITATIDGDDNRNVMLVTLPVYSKEGESKKETGKEKGELHLWLTDNTHIVDIGPVSDDDVAASSLLYKSAGSGDNNELIALYEKEEDDEKPSPGMVSVRLTEQLQRVKDVLETWKKVDQTVSKLCPSKSAVEDTSPEDACRDFKVTDGLVGFLSGNFSENTWRDEYLGVNATVKGNDDGAGKATLHEGGVKFTGAWAEWPVGSQGENQLYHFANYNFTLVATVSIDKVPTEGNTPIPLMGVKLNDNENKENSVLFGLSYDSGKKRAVLCSGQTTKDHSSDWNPDTTHQVAIVLRNGTQGSAYVDGQRVGGDEECTLGSTKSQEISHFYIGGDAGSAEDQEGFSVTVSNVLLYNRPLAFEEIAGLAKNKITIPKPEVPKTSTTSSLSPAVSGSDVQGTVHLSNSAGQRPSEQGQPKESNDAGAGGASGAASVTTPSADANTPASNGEGQVEPAVKKEMSVNSGEDGETAEGTDVQQEGIHSHNGEVNATALSSLGNVSQGNNTDAGTVRGSGLPSLLLLLGLWGFAAL